MLPIGRWDGEEGGDRESLSVVIFDVKSWIKSKLSKIETESSAWREITRLLNDWKGKCTQSLS